MKYNYFYSFVNKEIGKRQTCRHMTITDVKTEYMIFLNDRPREELRNELLELKYRLDYKNDSVDFITTLITSTVNFVAVLIGFTVGNIFVSESEIMSLMKLFAVLFVYLSFIIAALHLCDYMIGYGRSKKHRFDKFKSDCIKEVLQSKTAKVKVRYRKRQ